MATYDAIVELLGANNQTNLQAKLNDKELGFVVGGDNVQVNDNGTFLQLGIRNKTQVWSAQQEFQHTAEPIISQYNSSETATVKDALILRHETSGNMANNYGVGINFQISDPGAADQTVGVIDCIRSGADNTGTIRIRPFNAGAAVTAMTISNAGAVAISGNLTVATDVFVLNASTKRIGIGGTPSANYGDYILDIIGATSSGDLILSTQQADGAVVVGKIQGNYDTNSAGYKDLAQINFESAGATANKRGGEIVFATQQDNTNTAYERVRISHKGQTQMVMNDAMAIPVLSLQQLDVDEPFTKYIGTAAAADLTRSIVDVGDVGAFTAKGYIKIEVQDDGNQITDQDYFIEIGTLA